MKKLLLISIILLSIIFSGFVLSETMQLINDKIDKDKKNDTINPTFGKDKNAPDYVNIIKGGWIMTKCTGYECNSLDVKINQTSQIIEIKEKATKQTGKVSLNVSIKDKIGTAKDAKKVIKSNNEWIYDYSKKGAIIGDKLQIGDNTRIYEYTNDSLLQYDYDWGQTNIYLTRDDNSVDNLFINMRNNSIKWGGFDPDCKAFCDYKITINSTSELIPSINNATTYLFPDFYVYNHDNGDEERHIFSFQDVCKENYSNCSWTFDHENKNAIISFKSMKRIDPTINNVTGCMTISSQNETWVLNKSLVYTDSNYYGVCINIQYANNITFNCNAFNISNTYANTGTAMQLYYARNIRVLNCSLYNTYWGIHIYASDNISITNTSINAYFTGIMNDNFLFINNYNLENLTFNKGGSFMSYPLYFIYTNNLSIKNVDIYGNGVSSNEFYTVSYLTVDGLMMKDTQAQYGLDLRFTTHDIIKNLQFSNFTVPSSIAIANGYGGNFNVSINNVSARNIGYFISSQSSGSYTNSLAYIRNINVTNAYSGIDNNNFYNLILDNVTMNNITTYGLNFLSSNHLNISNIEINNVGKGGILFDRVTDINMTNVKISSTNLSLDLRDAQRINITDSFFTALIGSSISATRNKDFCGNINGGLSSCSQITDVNMCNYVPASCAYQYCQGGTPSQTDCSTVFGTDSTCAQVTGCTFTQSCDGSATCTISDSNVCSNMGCSYGCNGYTSYDCTAITDQTACTSYTSGNCQWFNYDYCSGNLGCGNYNNAYDCSTDASMYGNCVWTPSVCTGNLFNSCSYITDQTTCNNLACSYSCYGSPSQSCSYESSSSSGCNSISGCSFTQSCSGTISQTCEQLSQAPCDNFFNQLGCTVNHACTGINSVSCANYPVGNCIDSIFSNKCNQTYNGISNIGLINVTTGGENISNNQLSLFKNWWYESQPNDYLRANASVKDKFGTIISLVGNASGYTNKTILLQYINTNGTYKNYTPYNFTYNRGNLSLNKTNNLTFNVKDFYDFPILTNPVTIKGGFGLEKQPYSIYTPNGIQCLEFYNLTFINELGVNNYYKYCITKTTKLEFFFMFLILLIMALVINLSRTRSKLKLNFRKSLNNGQNNVYYDSTTKTI